MLSFYLTTYTGYNIHNINMGKVNNYLTSSIARVWVAAIIGGFIILLYQALYRIWSVMTTWE